MDIRKFTIASALAVQLALPSLLTLVYPCEVLQKAGASAAQIDNTLSLTLFALAVAVVLQSFRRGPVGGGVLLPSLSSGLHLSPSLLAVKMGGLAAVAGMTVFAGLSEMVFSFFVLRLRALFSHAVVGLILLLVGVEIVRSGLHIVFRGALGDVVLSVVAGILLILGQRFGGRLWRTLSPVAVFVLISVVGGMLEHNGHPDSFSWFGLPVLPAVKLEFRPELILPFLAAAIASGIRALSGVEILQEGREGNGLRIREGIRADATGTLLCGLAGSIGCCAALNSISAEKAAGTGNPRIAWGVALVLVLAALCPALPGFIAMAPGCAKGPLLIFYGVLMAIPGMREIGKDRGRPGFGWQVGIPLVLVALAMAHGELLRFGGRPWLPALEGLADSLMAIGIVSALAVRICIRFRFRGTTS